MNELAAKTYRETKATIDKLLLTKFLIAILVLCCVLSYSINNVLNTIYKICVFAEVLLLIVCAFKCRLNRLFYWIFLICIAMVFMRVISIRDNSVNYNINAIVQMAIIAAILCTNDILVINKSTVNFYNKILFTVCILGIIDYCLSTDKYTFTIFGSMNTFAGVFLFLLAVEWVLARYYFEKKCVFNIICCLALILLSDSRTPLLVIALFILNLFLLKKVFKNKSSKKCLLIIYVAILCVFIYFYINIDQWDYYKYFNDLSTKYFNKNIDSGRPDIWANTLKLIKNNWLLGVGYAMYGTDYSVHNQYIQLLGDNGVIGIVLLTALFIIIWFEFVKYSDDKVVRISMAMMLAFIVYNCFEVTLLQNKFAVGCLQWLIISIGLNRCRRLRYKRI